MTCEEWQNKANKECTPIQITEDYKWVPSGVEVVIESKDPNVVALAAANKKIEDLNK